MQTKHTLKLIATCLAFTGARGLFAQHAHNPYAGQQARSINALS